MDQLSAIGRLPFGWDSHGAAPPTEEAVRAAHFFLGEIARLIDPPRPRINPTPSGGVQFEWEDGQRYLEIEVIGSGSADYYYEDRSEGLIDEGSLPANIPTRDLIERNS